KHLREQAVSVARKHVAERNRRRLGCVEFADRQTHEWSAELDCNSRVRGQVAKTHDPADCALASDQNRLDIAAVFIGDEIGGKARVEGEVEGVAVIAGLKKKV